VPKGLRQRVRLRQALVAAVAGGSAIVLALAVSIGVGQLARDHGSVPANPVPSFPPPVPGVELTWSASGGTHVGTGTSLGIDWTIRSFRDGRVEITGGGRSSVFVGRDAFGLLDVQQGSLYFGSANASVERVDVVRRDGAVFRGMWMPAASGGGRLWLVGLPGPGTGFALRGTATPSAISWPAGTTTPGSVVDAGAAPSGASWWLGFPAPAPSPYCLALQTIQGDTEPCLVAGSGREVLASEVTSVSDSVVAFTVPSDVTYVEAKTAGGSLAGGTSCSEAPRPAPPEWSGRALCVAALFQESGTAALRFYDGSGGGPQQDWPQVLPPMQITWSSGSFSLHSSTG
jgi:hypothetical protein